MLEGSIMNIESSGIVKAKMLNSDQLNVVNSNESDIQAVQVGAVYAKHCKISSSRSIKMGNFRGHLKVCLLRRK